MNALPSPLDRLKILINSSTPIVIMETVEEMRALSLVRAACSDLGLAVFEWTIADGLLDPAAVSPLPRRHRRIPKAVPYCRRAPRLPLRGRPCTTPPTPSRPSPTSRP